MIYHHEEYVKGALLHEVPCELDAVDRILALFANNDVAHNEQLPSPQPKTASATHIRLNLDDRPKAIRVESLTRLVFGCKEVHQ